MEGAVGAQSNVHDLFNYYAAAMTAAEDQTKTGKSSTSGSPLKRMAALFNPHVSSDAAPSPNERSYGMGYIRTKLPGTLGIIGLNSSLTKEMPVVGKGLDRKHLCIYHQGVINSFLNSVHLLPESLTAIVVLTKSLNRSDTADWLGQLLLQTVLNVPKASQNDYVKIFRDSAEISNAIWPRKRQEL